MLQNTKAMIIPLSRMNTNTAEICSLSSLSWSSSWASLWKHGVILYNNGCVPLYWTTSLPTPHSIRQRWLILPLSGSTSHLIIIITRMILDDDHTNASSGDPCKEIWRTKTKMKITWLDLFVNFWQRIFGKDAKPGELGILGVVLLQEGGVHHFAGSTKPAIGFAPDQATKAKIHHNPLFSQN